MKKIIKSVDKAFPLIGFGCDFCGAEFVVSPPEKDMNINVETFPRYEFGSYKESIITTYITHCPVCGERASWSVKERIYDKKEDFNE